MDDYPGWGGAWRMPVSSSSSSAPLVLQLPASGVANACSLGWRWKGSRGAAEHAEPSAPPSSPGGCCGRQGLVAGAARQDWAAPAARVDVPRSGPGLARENRAK